MFTFYVVQRSAERERERERYRYLPVVTGTRYGTKTPPGQQPTNLRARDMTRALFTRRITGMISRVRCLLGYDTRWALSLFALAMGRMVVRLGGRSAPLFLGLSDHAALQPVFLLSACLGVLVLERLAFLSKSTLNDRTRI